jgi:hypothetical protein
MKPTIIFTGVLGLESVPVVQETTPTIDLRVTVDTANGPQVLRARAAVWKELAAHLGSLLKTSGFQ